MSAKWEIKLILLVSSKTHPNIDKYLVNHLKSRKFQTVHAFFLKCNYTSLDNLGSLRKSLFFFRATLTNNDQIKVPIRDGLPEKKDEATYNPYEHRDVEHPNRLARKVFNSQKSLVIFCFSFSGALIHLLKSSLGTGILAIPRAFRSAGLLVGLFGTVIIGILCTHTIHVLVSQFGIIAVSIWIKDCWEISYITQ